MTDLEHVVVGADEVLLLITKDPLTPTEADWIKGTVTKMGLDGKVLVIDGTTLDVKVVKREQG